jgi:two-component system sensor histidine kinase ChvG
LLLSTQAGDIDKIVHAERWRFSGCLALPPWSTLSLSLLAGQHHRHTAQASVRRRRPCPARRQGREEIPDFSDRQDEIGNLSVALRDMTNALYDRIAAIESFAADVSHELKNPLTSLRSAVETLPLGAQRALPQTASGCHPA